MEDLISRQAAIDVLTESLNKIPMINNTTNEMIRRDERITCIHEIIRLPAAEPKTGKWIKLTGMMPPEFHGHHCCSECGRFANMEPPFGNREDLSKFCPNCGAKMVREEGEEE